MRIAALKQERFVFAGIIALELWAHEHGAPLRRPPRRYSLKPLTVIRRFVATGRCVSGLVALVCRNQLRSSLSTHSGQPGLIQSSLAIKLLAP